MKIIFKTLLIMVSLSTSFTTINASTITWLGGNAAWDDASQWDTGKVPSYGDDIIIPSGYCKIFNGDSEGVMSVEVQSAARLYVYNGGYLEITGAVDNDGLHNMGRLYIYGNLEISDITQTNTANSANAIRNENIILTYPSSKINIQNIDDVAIENASAYSYFRMKGGLWINSVNDIAILNQDRFYNYGSIDIVNSGETTGFLIVNSDNFRNYSGATINLNSGIYCGISNATTASSFKNSGDIDIDEVTIAIVNEGQLTNHNEGYIDAQNNNSASYHNREGATITNDGYMVSSLSDSGIYNYGTLINNNSFIVFDNNAYAGIRNFTTGIIENYKSINLNGLVNTDVKNDGIITNHYGSYFSVNNAIDLSLGSDFTNYGFFASYGTDIHNINGAFENEGLVDDDHGLLQGNISNDKLLVAPVAGPMQVGVPYPNVLDVASLVDVNILSWKVSPNGAVAGTYDESTNEFTPNASAIGISTIYIVIFDLVSGNGRNFSLEIGSPILPFTKNNKTATTRNELDQDFADNRAIDVKIYPNPTSGNIELNGDVFENIPTQIHIYNNLGQLVQQEKIDSESQTQTINFSNQLTSGLYYLKMIQNGKEIDVKRIQLVR